MMLLHAVGMRIDLCGRMSGDVMPYGVGFCRSSSPTHRGPS